MGRSTDACHKTFCQQAESLLFNELGHVAIWIGLLRHCKTFKRVCNSNTDDISKEACRPYTTFKCQRKSQICL